MQSMTLERYFKEGGKVENINPDNCANTFIDDYKGMDIVKVQDSGWNTKQVLGINHVRVTFSNGESQTYHPQWIIYSF